MSSDTIEKAGGRVGIVGTGHRARVCPRSFSSFFPFLSFTPLRPLNSYIVSYERRWNIVSLCNGHQKLTPSYTPQPSQPDLPPNS